MTRPIAPRIAYTKAVDKFLIENREWLSHDHDPAVAMLLELAGLLDEGRGIPADRAQFGMTYRDLLNRKPKPEKAPVEVKEESPIAAAIRQAKMRSAA